MSSDLYEILGVSRDASIDEIRRAYKAQAREKHPDRGGDTEEFKKLQEAHEILSDEGRRKMYDMTGSVSDHAPPGGGMGMAAGGIPFHFMSGMGPFGMPGVAFDIGGMFNNMFGGGGGAGRRSKMPRGPNKHHDIGLSLSDFYNGKEIKIKFNQARKCGSCAGTGAETSEKCGACNGSGSRVQTHQIGPGMMATSRGPCDVCSGEGTRIMRPCITCGGKKFNERPKQLDIKIIPGMRDGESMTFVGECSESSEFETPGDVILNLRRTDAGIGEIDEYEWKENNLVIRKKIKFAESILGFMLNLDDHPSGKKPKLLWRDGPLIHGAVLKMVGGGMPKKGGGHGDLFVQIMVEAPPTRPWSDEEASKLQSVLGGSPILDTSDIQKLELKTAESELVVEK